MLKVVIDNIYSSLKYIKSTIFQNVQQWVGLKLECVALQLITQYMQSSRSQPILEFIICDGRMVLILISKWQWPCRTAGCMPFLLY